MGKARDKYESPASAAPAMMLETDTEKKQKREMRFLRERYTHHRSRHSNHQNHKCISRRTGLGEGQGRHDSQSENSVYPSYTEGYSIKEKVDIVFNAEYFDMIARVQEQEDRMHEVKISDPKHSSETYWGMVHTPNKIDHAMRIPNAKAAVDHEWNKFEMVKKAWNSSEVFERAEITENAKKLGKKVYLANSWICVT